MSRKKKAPQSMQGFFRSDARRSGGRKPKIKSRQDKYSKEPECSAVKGVAVADGAQHP